MPKTVVIACAGSLGDLHPFMWLAKLLECHGFLVKFATQAAFSSVVHADGLEAYPIRPVFEDLSPALAKKVFHPLYGPAFLIRELLLPYLRESYDDLYAIAKDADLLITSELMFASPLVAEKLSIPWLSTVLQPMSFMSVYDPPALPAIPFSEYLRILGPRLTSLVFNVVKTGCQNWDRPVQALRKQLELPLTLNPVFDGKYSPYGTLALFSPLIGKPQPDWPVNTMQDGFPLYDASHSEPLPVELERFLGEGKAPVVFTLGSAAVMTAENFYEVSASAAKKLGIKALLLTGRNAVPAFLPSTIMAWPYAPYSQVFSRARLVVHQGGIGTTAQVLKAGKPMLIVPFGFDQYDNAHRVVRLGVGEYCLRNQYAEKTVCQLLDTMLRTPAYQQQALRCAQEMEESTAGKKTVAFIQNLIR